MMVSDYKKPLNIGSDEMVSMNQMAELVFKIGGKTLPIKHIPGPEGVRGRNSDNTLIKEVPNPGVRGRGTLALTLTRTTPSSRRCVLALILPLPLPLPLTRCSAGHRPPASRRASATHMPGSRRRP